MSNISDFLGSVGGSSRTYTVSDLGSPTGDITLDLSTANVFKFDLNNTERLFDSIIFTNIPTNKREEGWIIIDYGTSDLKRLMANTTDFRNLLSSEITLADSDYTFFDQYWKIDGTTIQHTISDLTSTGDLSKLETGNYDELTSSSQYIYAIDNGLPGVRQYDADLSDISSGVTINTDFSTISYGDMPSSVSFSNDGTIMYITINDDDGTNNIKNSIYQFSLSTPWDLSTATFSHEGVVEDKNLSGTSIRDIHFNPNGYEYITLQFNANWLSLDGDEYKFRRYRMTTQWDTSTGVLVETILNPFSFPPISIDFKPDGTKVYLGFQSGSLGGIIQAHDLSVPWDLSTSSLSESYDNGTGSATVGINFLTGLETSGNMLFLDGSGNLYQANTGNKYEILKFQQYNTDKILLMRGEI